MVKKSAKKNKKEIPFCTRGKCDSSGGIIYFLGFIGAAIYYISLSTNFWLGVLGVLKAVLWPLIIVFELLKFLGA